MPYSLYFSTYLAKLQELQAVFEIAEDVLEIHEGFVGGGVGGKIGVDIAIVPIFGAHGIGVVGGGEVAPGANELWIMGGENAVA